MGAAGRGVGRDGGERSGPPCGGTILAFAVRGGYVGWRYRKESAGRVRHLGRWPNWAGRRASSSLTVH